MRAWLRTVGFLMRKEALQVRRDRATMFQVLAIPIVQLLVLANVATFEIRDSAVHVVDLDRTGASRALIQRFLAAGAFRIVESSTSLDAADRDLVAGDADLVLAIPAGFEKDLVVRGRATVRLAIDAEQGAAAAIVRAYAARIIQDFAAGRSLEARARARMVA
ncbi:MAG: ABC transporter permease, partial [Longimicrobiales bacterium]